MRNLFLIATAIVSVVGATAHQAGACTLRFPAFEVTGFPVSRLQVAVLGGAHVEESSATPELMSAGMPASPNQIALLTPQPKAMIVEASADPSQLTVGIARPRSQKSTAEMCAAD
jgi:hypothetical protein